jgi:hypothetical protein
VPLWLGPAAFGGGLFMGLAGVRHAMNPQCNARETMAMVTDLILFAVAPCSWPRAP